MSSLVGGAPQPGGGGPIPGASPTAGAGNSGSTRGAAEQRLQLLQEMRCQNFDLIRFASYRTACKLRFVQKKLNLNLVDIWNVIEAFRENGLNTLEPTAELNVARLETLVSSLYHNLNKRLPLQQQVNVEADSSLLLNWLLSAYYFDSLGKIRVFSIKVALATMCAGKLMDKLRYMFSQVCDSNGYMVAGKFSQYLKQVLALPAAVYESPSFPYREELASEIFAGNGKVTVNDFMDTMMSDPAPASLVWLPLLHRLASVENVIHATVCDACHRENYTGFRYRCAKCHSFQMCQDCFWRGRVASTHTIEHDVKEYTTYKSPSKQIGHSLRKSFRCVPDKGKANIPRFPDHPEKPLNLSHIVPPSPLPSHNGFPDYTSGYDMGSLDSRSTARSPGKCVVQAMMRLDDEHKLIARYAARLAQEAHQHSQQSQQQQQQQGRTPTDMVPFAGLDTSRAQRELITQLEAKNREIMREIARLRREQEVVGNDDNPALMSELRALRQRKDELESHLTSLQDSRRHLMLQLEGLMKLLKNHQASPRSTPNSSPRSSKSPPPSSRSAPPTPTPNPGGIGGGSGGVLEGCMMTSSVDSRPSLTASASQLVLGSNSAPGSVYPSSGGGCLPSSNTASLSGPPTPVSQQQMMMMNNGMPQQQQQPQSKAPLPGQQQQQQPGMTSPPLGGRSICNDLLEAADSVTNAMSSLVRELNSEGSDQDDTPTGVQIRKPLDFEGENEDDDDYEDDEEWRRPAVVPSSGSGGTLVSASLVLGSSSVQHQTTITKDYPNHQMAEDAIVTQQLAIHRRSIGAPYHQLLEAGGEPGVGMLPSGMSQSSGPIQEPSGVPQQDPWPQRWGPQPPATR